MVQFCCAGGCQNSSANRKDISFHGLRLNSKSLLSVWITKMKRDPRYFNVNRHTKICSEHFTSDDFIDPYSSKKRLKADAVPSIFSWNIDKQENVQPVKRAALEKLNQLNEKVTYLSLPGLGKNLFLEREEVFLFGLCERPDPSHVVFAVHILKPVLSHQFAPDWIS